MKKTVNFDRVMMISITLMSLCAMAVAIWVALDLYPAEQYANALSFSDVVFVTLPYFFSWLALTLLLTLAMGIIVALPVAIIGFLLEWGYTRV